MLRTKNCGELKIKDVNRTVILCGWVQTIRKFGAITFVDLRDRYGITQLLFGDGWTDRLDAEPLGREDVLQVEGFVQERTNKNYNIPTGEIEVRVEKYQIINKSALPPFTITDPTDGGDDLRMKYRYLDLRRSSLQKNMALRFAIGCAVRNYLNENDFIDIETPFLIKSTPEGARDFVVPSRMNPGEFYALPQSPQTFKQLLMVSGFDRYYQIVKCFRDEDLRSDRQPEFTQIDCEMSFVEQEDILDMFEGLIKNIFKEVKDIEYEEEIERLTYEEALFFYGNDKPDTRFNMRIGNLKFPAYQFTDLIPLISPQDSKLNFRESGFKVFDEAETILAIAVPEFSEASRKQIDELTNWVKRPQIGMNGLIYIRKNTDGSIKSSIDKFYSEEQLNTIATACGATEGDLILILAGKEEKTRKAMSELRLEMGKRLDLRKANEFKLLWVVDFPLFEYSDEDNRWVARHHPFTAPKPDQVEILLNNKQAIPPGSHYAEHPYFKIKANAYDMVLNGNEIGGGSIRIYRKELQQKMFEALGLSKEEAQEKFGFLMKAFEYGAPPHGGIAFGFDRLCAILGGSESIRDFIAFPKNNSGRDVMLDAPSPIDEKQLKELDLQVISAKER